MSVSGAPMTRTLTPAEPIDISATLAALRHGRHDPTVSRVQRTWWLGQITPDGPATVAVSPDGSAIDVSAWGPGAAWVIDGADALVGLLDDPSEFEPHHDVIARLWRRFAGWRIVRSRQVLQALVPACLEQRVTGVEAYGSFRQLVRLAGQLAPGPGGQLGLYVPPTAQAWRLIPSWQWLRAGVDRSRSDPAVRSAARADSLEALASLPAETARQRLVSLPGVGVWTAAEVAQRAFGDPDAVSFGDYHVAKNIGWALTGSPIDDDALAQLLEPYAGHRYRVQALIALAGLAPPRRGPRRSLPRHLPR